MILRIFASILFLTLAGSAWASAALDARRAGAFDQSTVWAGATHAARMAGAFDVPTVR